VTLVENAIKAYCGSVPGTIGTVGSPIHPVCAGAWRQRVLAQNRVVLLAAINTPPLLQ
jgi:hypothetical protein